MRQMNNSMQSPARVSHCHFCLLQSPETYSFNHPRKRGLKLNLQQASRDRAQRGQPQYHLPGVALSCDSGCGPSRMVAHCPAWSPWIQPRLLRALSSPFGQRLDVLPVDSLVWCRCLRGSWEVNHICLAAMPCSFSHITCTSSGIGKQNP